MDFLEIFAAAALGSLVGGTVIAGLLHDEFTSKKLLLAAVRARGLAWRRNLQFCLLGFMGISASASAKTYYCTTTSAQAIGNDGEVVDNTAHLRERIGENFSIEASTGEIRGSYFINNKHAQSVELVGSPESGRVFIISTSHGPGQTVGYLALGPTAASATRWFTFTSSGQYLYFGICE